MDTSTQPFVRTDAKKSFFARNKRSLLLAGIAVSAVVALSVAFTASHSSDDNSSKFLFGRHVDSSEPEVGVYWRPPAEETSGEPGTDKKYKRSPCPALNTLANYGFLPRDGEDLSINMLGSVLSERYNLDWKVGAGLGLAARVALKKLPWQSLSLSDLSTHNAIEHDASLFHYDSATLRDPSEVNVVFVNQLIYLAGDKDFLGLDEVIEFRKGRIAESSSNNPEFSLSGFHQNVANGEAAILLDILGRDQQIPIEHLKSFVIDEKFPEDWVKASEVVTRSMLKPTIDAITQGLEN